MLLALAAHPAPLTVTPPTQRAAQGAMDLPHRFGKYELLEHVATGGMAEVFRARSFGVDGFEKHLVIKRILPGLARDPRFVGLFVKEARISAGMSHPNLVQVYELGRVVDDHYMAMEFIHGRDLARVGRALRRSGGRVPVNLAVYIAVSVMRALAYAHALTDPVGRPLGLVHRDVSPHNVMLGFEGEVKLFDFGIAGLSGEGTGGGGKHGYLSPEQLDGATLDGRSDVFCVGILLWELITGQRLFGGADLEAKRIAVRAAVIPDPRDAEPRVPQALVTVLRHMLARRVEDRPESADAAAEMLSAALFPQFPAADARAARAFMRDLFPEEAARPSGATVDLGGLARDLEALGEGTLSRVITPSPEPFSAEPASVRLRLCWRLAGGVRSRARRGGRGAGEWDSPHPLGVPPRRRWHLPGRVFELFDLVLLLWAGERASPRATWWRASLSAL